MLGFNGNPGNVETEPENYVLTYVGMEINYETDTDGDGLPDYYENHIALHSDTTQWQSLGGYNDFYDWAFNVATSMNKLPLKFNSDWQDYVVWAWKGNYLNLGAGSEVGFYTKNNTIEEHTGLEQWMVDKEFPMTLSLYKMV